MDTIKWITRIIKLYATLKESHFFVFVKGVIVIFRFLTKFLKKFMLFNDISINNISKFQRD